MDIVMLARWAKIGGEKVERHDQLNVAFANRFGEKMNEHELD